MIYKPTKPYFGSINDLVEIESNLIQKGGPGSGVRGHQTAELDAKGRRAHVKPEQVLSGDHPNDIRYWKKKGEAEGKKFKNEQELREYATQGLASMDEADMPYWGQRIAYPGQKK